MYAPASAAKMACAGEKTRVTLIRMPSLTSRVPASSPSGVIGTFTTAFGPIAASVRPCTTIPSASGAVPQMKNDKRDARS